MRKNARIKLYGRLDKATNLELTRETLSYLEGQGVRVVGFLPKCIILEKGWRWFTLADNGGEINVEPINHPEEMRSIPYTSTGRALDTLTMAYRLLKAMSGAKIDYNWLADEGSKIYA